MLTKRQIGIGVGIVSLIIIVILIAIFKKESFIIEKPEIKEKVKEIRENFPQTSGMNVLYSDISGNLSSTSDLGVDYLSVNNDISANRRIYFRNTGHSDDSDVYFLEKKRDSENNNSLRLYINDDADESFQIWGNSCASHGCTGDGGTMKHKFVANGNAEHTGALSVGGSLSAGTTTTGALTSDSISTGGSIFTNRQRLRFSGLNDSNHTIYNNYNNIDNEGKWDGMKMNVYDGLDVRTGDASGATPKTVLSVRDGGVTVNDWLYAKGWSNFGSGHGTGGSVTIEPNHTWNGTNTSNPRISYGGVIDFYQHGTGARMQIDGNNIKASTLKINGRDILAELDDLKNNVVRRDRSYLFRNKQSNNCIYNNSDGRFSVWSGCGGVDNNFKIIEGDSSHW